MTDAILHNEEHGQNLIEIGVDLGVYTIANLMLEGATFDRRVLQELSDKCALHIEEMTNMPAEDFALIVKPIVDQVIKTAKAKE